MPGEQEGSALSTGPLNSNRPGHHAMHGGARLERTKMDGGRVLGGHQPHKKSHPVTLPVDSNRRSGREGQAHASQSPPGPPRCRVHAATPGRANR